MMNPPLHYHRLLIALHWVLAVLIAIALLMGSTQLVSLSNASPDKIFALRAHMVAGAAILVLTIVRLIVKVNTAKPAPATTGNPLLDTLGRLTHVVLYLLVFGMVGSGIAMAIQANLPAAVFSLSAPLPPNFDHLAPRLAHGYIAKALIALVGLHIAAALYHQFVRKDDLIYRMWWKNRN